MGRVKVLHGLHKGLYRAEGWGVLKGLKSFRFWFFWGCCHVALLLLQKDSYSEDHCFPVSGLHKLSSFGVETDGALQVQELEQAQAHKVWNCIVLRLFLQSIENSNDDRCLSVYTYLYIHTCTYIMHTYMYAHMCIYIHTHFFHVEL